MPSGRRVRRRALALWLVIGAVAVGTAALALRYTVFFEAQKEWYRLVYQGPPAPEQRAVLSARHHRASTPCLRWLTSERDVDEDQALAAELVAAGLVDRAGKAMLLTVVWQVSEENAVHARGAAEELLDLAAERAGPLDRLLIALHRDRLLFVADLDVPADVLATMQRDAEAALSPARIERLRAVWESHKLVFARTRNMAERVRRVATEQRLAALEAALNARLEKGGALPAKLDELGAEGARPALEDGWGSPFSFEATPDGARLASLGPNLRPDGGDDIVREITAPVREDGSPVKTPDAPPTPAVPPPFDCSAAPPLRVEIQAPADAKVDQEMRSHRFVPEQVEGKPVGVRVFGVRSDHIAARAGLCNGDRLVSVDGRPPPATAAELAARCSRDAARNRSYCRGATRSRATGSLSADAPATSCRPVGSPTGSLSRSGQLLLISIHDEQERAPRSRDGRGDPPGEKLEPPMQLLSHLVE